MTPIELIADNLRRNLELLKMTLADFSDADMMVRPCPGANHALWQLGLLVNGEVSMLKACNAGADNTCPFTEGVGVSGVYFSFDGGASWTQPTYQGLSGRSCTGAPGDTDPGCTPQMGPIGTLPWYAQNGLVADGDPAVAVGPVYKNGSFSWTNGSRAYYANLTSKTPGSTAFKGF
jgi:hypothetical protein